MENEIDRLVCGLKIGCYSLWCCVAVVDLCINLEYIRLGTFWHSMGLARNVIKGQIFALISGQRYTGPLYVPYHTGYSVIERHIPEGKQHQLKKGRN